MRSLLQRIATGPELSKDISEEEAFLGMNLILEDAVDPVQAALFLIALRMKRETIEEVLGVQRALLSACGRLEADVDEVVDVADPFNGYARGLPVSPFLPAVLASCGVPSCSYGVAAVGPKYGITHHNVLSASGVDVGLSVRQAVERINDADIGWAYLDQSVVCPKLYKLLDLRHLMVKRTCLTTIEVALRPVGARRRNHLVTGYVHKPYPPIYTMLARAAGYASAVVVRGVEGGVIPSLQQPSKLVRWVNGSTEVEWRIDPGMVGITGAAHRAVPMPDDVTGRDEDGRPLDVGRAAMTAAVVGEAALNGEPGPAYDSLVYSAAVVLAHLEKGSISQCGAMVRDALDRGAAADRFNRGR